MFVFQLVCLLDDSIYTSILTSRVLARTIHKTVSPSSRLRLRVCVVYTCDQWRAVTLWFVCPLLDTIHSTES